jgi:hypothetical protein
LTVELGHRVDEPGKADAPRDSIEIAVQGHTKLSDHVQRAKLCGLLPVF